MSLQIISLKSPQISGNLAEFWPGRLLAFELRRWGYAARVWCQHPDGVLPHTLGSAA